jgi:hypothetical protein
MLLLLGVHRSRTVLPLLLLLLLRGRLRSLLLGTPIMTLFLCACMCVSA